MKSILALLLLLAAFPAAAQPAPGAGSGAGSDQPLPNPEQPSWLPGVQDVTAAETATPGKLTITMQRAVEIAMRQNPTARQARATAEAAAGRVDLAKIPERPTLSVAGTLGAGNKIPRPCDALDPNSPTCGGFFTTQESTGLSATATWRIYDFGLTRANVNAAQANAEAASAGIGTTGLDIRTNVELAYLEAVARGRLILVAQATVKSEEAHLDQAKRFVAAQAHDPIEVQQAQARAANARSALAQAQSNEAVALANLRAAIGWLDPTRAPAVDPSWPTPSEQEPPDLAGLVDNARKNRPEIVAADKQIAAADASLTAAHAERRPILSAQAGTAWNPGTGDWSPQPTWQAGLTLSWLAWDAGRSRADVRVANANRESAIASRDALLVSLTSALESARAQIVSNRANVQASNEAVAAAQAELKLAEARYAQGLGSQIELADAQTAVTTAEGNLVQAEWQLADAWASLRRATAQTQ
ncbi:MAG: TolC family protein [Deltaproteobacteria bacterium]|nr:TolC family protein [Deltaproteobacteria bacterium]